MKKVFACCIIFMALISCSTNKHLHNDPQGLNKIADSSRDGSSYEKAIVIEEATETKGVAAEYAWLKQKYPGYKMITQSLSPHEKKFYDVLKFQTGEGKMKTAYFDITNFYGKGLGF